MYLKHVSMFFGASLSFCIVASVYLPIYRSLVSHYHSRCRSLALSLSLFFFFFRWGRVREANPGQGPPFPICLVEEALGFTTVGFANCGRFEL